MSAKVKMHAQFENEQPCILHMDRRGGTLEIAQHDVLTPDAIKREDMPAEQEIHLKLENGRCATLLHNYNKGWHSHLGGVHSFVLSEVGSNCVLIGPTWFGLNQLVERIEGHPSDPEISICYHGHQNHRRISLKDQITAENLLARNHAYDELIIDVIDTRKLNACKIQMKDASLSISISISEFSGPKGRGIEQKPKISIDYISPISLQRAQDDLYCVTSFLSFVSGSIIRAKDVLISIPDHDQQYHDKFELRTPQPEEQEGTKDRDGRWAIFTLDHHYNDYVEALQKWFERRDTWNNSYNYFRSCLLQENSISRDHYLAALAWFESIPLFYLQNQVDVDRNVLLSAARSAVNEFKKANVNISEGRICNLLAPLNTPSLGTKLREAAQYINHRFGIADGFLLEKDAVKNITKIRGQYAHGNIPEASFSTKQIYKCLLTVEVLSYFLTLSGFPCKMQNIQDAHDHPLQWALRFLNDKRMVTNVT